MKKGAPQSPAPPAKKAPTNFKAKDYERPGVSIEEVNEIKQAFDLFDTDLGGSIDIKELKAAMTSLGFQSKSNTIFQMIAELDADGSGALDFVEFFDLMVKKVSDKDTKAGVHKMFNLFDDDKKGFISIQNLRRVALQLNENCGEEELNEMLNRADGDHDGYVSEAEFYNIVTKKSFV